MIKISIKNKQGEIGWGAQFATQEAADAWVTEQIVNGSWGRPERWVLEPQEDIEGHIDTRTAVTTGASTWKFTAPISSVYALSGCFSEVGVARDAGSNSQDYLIHSVSGTHSRAGYQSFQTASTLEGIVMLSGRAYMNAGDTITMVEQALTGTWTRAGDRSANFLSIIRQAGPTAIAASENVYMTVATTAAQNIPNNAITAITGWTDKTSDSHNAFNTTTGIYTVPVAGTYQVNGLISFESVPANTTCDGFVSVYVNGNQLYYGQRDQKGGIASFAPYIYSHVSVVLRLNAGDTVALRAYQKQWSSKGYDNRNI